MPSLESTQLYKWLKIKDAALARRAMAVRDEQLKWMPLVVSLFAHYPSHCVEHSDRIIAQLSLMLFSGTKPVVAFSTVEVYCLICAAYLHDMGMVVPPGEIETILTSESWRAFVAAGGDGYAHFKAYEGFRDGPVQGSVEKTAFLSDLVLRYLVADFVRRDHHERGKTTLEMHPFLKQLVDDGDSVAFNTITALGVGHGLRNSELSDESRFPEERDVFGEKVNVRFLARLLRIGDLLDMSSKRADPITAVGVGPLPADAIPHWKQYSTTKHENICPKAIEFTFECKDQETHRILKNWFGWLETEIHEAGLEQLHADRHDNWKAPRCIVVSQANTNAQTAKTKPTIIIKPSAEAKYKFHDWKIELDHEQVLQRLIGDVYDDRGVFVRELIQNALDATRCQMYSDFAAQNPGIALPQRPTHFARDFRELYPILLSVVQEDVQLSPDGPTEKRHIFSIEDRGTGMSEEIISRYFLQVGRSYYQSNEFRERFKFAPTSRFGVGFLSVFGVSKDITVDTSRRDPETGKIAGIRLRLREPRNYLLTECWAPFEDRTTGSKTGTRIRVVLNEWPSDQSLAELAREWCVSVEVPVIVRAGGEEAVIRAERLIDKTVIATSKVDLDGRFILRTFDVDSHGVEGQVAVIAYEDADGEGWCDCWSREKDLGGERADKLPKVAPVFTALHGVALSGLPVPPEPMWRDSQWPQLCDVRTASATVSLARFEHMMHRRFLGKRRNVRTRDSSAVGLAAAAVEDTARRAVETHLAHSPRVKGPRGAYYVGNVLACAPVANIWRDNFPGTVVTWQNGTRVDMSVVELLRLKDVALAVWVCEDRYGRKPVPAMKRHPRDVECAFPIVSIADTPFFLDERFKAKLSEMNLVYVCVNDDLMLMTFSESKTGDGFERACTTSQSWIVPMSLDKYAAIKIDELSEGAKYFYLLPRVHPVLQWLLRLREAAQMSPSVINSAHVEALWNTASNSPYSLDEELTRWHTDSTVPPELKPPQDARANLVRFPYMELTGRVTVPK